MAVSQDLVKGLAASGIKGAQDLKLLLRDKEPAICTVFALENTVAKDIQTALVRLIS